MTESCQKLNAGVQLCSGAANASSAGVIEVQTLRDLETRERRQRLVIRMGKRSAPLLFCPWCGQDVDTSVHPPADEPSMPSRTPEKLQAEAKPAGLPKLAKAETVALWYAVNWMENVLHSWRGEGFKDERDQVLYQAEKERLRTAKQALRKVNRIRKEQGK